MTTHQDPRTQVQFPPPGFQSAIPVEQATQPHPAWEQQAAAAPPAEEEIEYGDYFGFDIRHKFIMPDGKQWIEFKTLNEGDLAIYQKELNRDVMVEKTTGNARIRINQVEERHALLGVAVTGWHMMQRHPARGWLPAAFSNSGKGSTFRQWLAKADPALVAELEKAVREQNPFLLQANTETLEAIDKQMADLQVQRDAILERMAEKENSATS